MNGKGGGSPCRRVRDSFFYIVFVINALELRIFFCDFDIFPCKIKALRRGLFQM